MKMVIMSSNHLVLAVCIILCLSVGCCGELAQAESGTGAEVAAMEKAEQAALYSAIQGFVGNWWNGSDLYPDPCGWTPIQGVSCDIVGGLWYVTGLSIGPVHDNSLGCATNLEFRPQVFRFKHLKSLSFFNCFVSPHRHPITIPGDGDKWEKLGGSLELLEFRSNPGLIGQLPTSFGYLTKLQSLVLLENGLTGELPTNIGNLTNLKRLVLAENRFTGKIPDSFGRLKKLLILDLSRNSLSGSLPCALGGLTSLLKLDLSNNQLEGKFSLGDLKNLTLLDLRNNKLSSGLLQSIVEMFCLEELLVSGNPLGGDILRIVWEKLPNLVILDLSNVGLIGEIPKSLSGLKRLRFVGLGNNNLTGNIPPNLASMPSLGALYLNGNNLTGVLKLSQDFYGKMGSRFGAWNNPNLCYPLGLMKAPYPYPYGVKPCQGLGLGNYVNQNSHFIESSGFSSSIYGISIHGVWRFFLILTLVLLLGGPI